MPEFHDFTLTEHDGDTLEVHDPPPVGALSLFSWELVTQMERYVGVDNTGVLVLYARYLPDDDGPRWTSLRFEPVRFWSRTPYGPLEGLVVRRVA